MYNDVGCCLHSLWSPHLLDAPLPLPPDEVSDHIGDVPHDQFQGEEKVGSTDLTNIYLHTWEQHSGGRGGMGRDGPDDRVPYVRR